MSKTIVDLDDIIEWKFPAGEVGVKLNETRFYTTPVEIVAKIRSSDDIMKLLMVTDAIKRHTKNPIGLFLPYVPYGRQDRVCNVGESLSIKVFADLINSQNYSYVKIIDPHIGLIYGDGMYMERFEKILEGMKQKGFATSNLVIGVGGLLLQQHNRDDLGFALKATKATYRDGSTVSLFKDPATDKKKKSKKGYLALKYDFGNKKYYTANDVDEYEEAHKNLLQTVFLDGKITKRQTLDDIREIYENDFKELV